MHEPTDLLPPIESILHRMPVWWGDAIDRINAKLDLGDQADLGPRSLSDDTQRFALAAMRKDSAVVGPFRPDTIKGLDYLRYEGDEADLAILLRNIHRYKSKLRSCSNGTFQQNDWRGGSLYTGDRRLIPLVCGCIREQDGAGYWTMSEVHIGVESGSGFEWAQMLWSKSRGSIVPRPEEQLSLVTPPKIRLRSDQPQEADTSKVGVEYKRVQDDTKRAEQLKQNERKIGPSEKGA